MTDPIAALAALPPEAYALLPPDVLETAHRLLQAEVTAKSRAKMVTLFPDEGPLRRELYVPHLRFFQLGTEKKERLLMAPNRAGKTVVGAFECTCHLTGKYPEWWQGRRFDKPVNIWAAGKTNQTCHDIIQHELFGPEVGSGPGKSLAGTGMVPGDDIGQITWKVGYPGLADTVQVKHVSGKWSRIGFKQYEQGRGAFEGTAKDVIWFDEEPPADVYTEALTRTATTSGIVMVTFTPLEGWSTIVKMFMAKDAPSHRAVVGMTWADVPHLSDEEKAMLESSYLPHERDARTKGIPSLGSGAIYPVAESDIICRPMEIPHHWKRFYAMDVGWNRTAAAWFAHDAESDTLYLYSEHYVGRAEPSIHAAAIRARGEWIMGVIDPASRGRSQVDGTQLLNVYRDCGLTLTPANNAVEAGIYAVWQRLSSGRLKVFANCENWLAEFRLYRRDDKGAIVKVDDHLMDVTRYACASGLAVATYAPDAWSKVAPTTKSSYRSSSKSTKAPWE